MSARKPAADRAEQNRATLKSLVKLEGNKSCADCKRNKHPRWASWNLGIFICIRCSGIHRGMGTHISKVKSVDLDSWTDEQMQSMLRWGNSRANKYWEAKLAPGHVPSEGKIENFIRTKYDSKRWVMDGPMPDPSTLGSDADDDVPLNVVKEKAQLERSASQRAPPSSSASIRAPPRQQPQQTLDLFGDESSAPPRPSTVEPTSQKAPAPPPKQAKAGDSLLGFDFFGGPSQAAPPRPASTTAAGPVAGAPSRPDLKQSILSLYASKPAAAQPVHQRVPSNAGFGGFQSPPTVSPTQSPPPTQSSFGGMNDAFSSLSFSSAPAAPPKPSPFAGLTSMSPKPAAPQTTTTSAFGSGGGFFDAPAPAPKPAVAPAQPNRSFSTSSGFGDFFTATSPVAQAPVASKPAATTNDLFDLSMPAASPAPPPKPAAPASSGVSNAFNLSSPKIAQPSPQPAQPAANIGSGWGNMDAWGGSNAWSSPDPTPAPAIIQQPKPVTATPALSNDFGGWGSSSASKSQAVSADDDFGGWSEAPAPAPVSSGASKPASGSGFGGSDDPFGNPWQ